MNAPLTQARLAEIKTVFEKHGGLTHTDGADLIEALQVALPALVELAGIQDRDGWTQNMGARVALSKIEGRL